MSSGLPRNIRLLMAEVIFHLFLAGERDLDYPATEHRLYVQHKDVLETWKPYSPEWLHEH